MLLVELLVVLLRPAGVPYPVMRGLSIPGDPGALRHPDLGFGGG